MSFSKITIIGNLGKDPELRYTPQGTAVCDFSVAVNGRQKDKQGAFQDVTTWYKVTFFGKQGENASKYLGKGKQVYIEGRLSVDEWQDRDGKARFTLAVVGSDMQFLSGGERGEGRDDFDREERTPKQEPLIPQYSGKSAADEDIPFAIVATLGTLGITAASLLSQIGAVTV